MSERTSYEPGTPSWVELSGTPDIDAAEAFYAGLLRLGDPGAPRTRADSAATAGPKMDGRDVAGVIAADAGGPAGGLGDLRLGRGRRRDDGQGRGRRAAR